jgi:hypothetical protein
MMNDQLQAICIAAVVVMAIVATIDIADGWELIPDVIEWIKEKLHGRR